MEIMEFMAAEHLKGAYPEPVAAHLSLPQWLKDDPNREKGIHPYGPGGTEGATYKRCVPFMDIMRTGYIIPLWADIAFSEQPCDEGCQDEDCPGSSIKVDWKGNARKPDSTQVERRGWSSWGNIPELKTGISHSSMTFINPWIIKTPPGYSTLITAPFNDDSRPHPAIKTLTGLVNTDTYHNQITFFFYMNYYITETLKKGTPLVQVIPIKREEWGSKITYITPGDENDMKHQQETSYLDSVFENGYRDRHGCPVTFK